MTRTPLEELQAAIYEDWLNSQIVEGRVPFVAEITLTRSERIKWLWRLALEQLPDDATPRLIAAPDMNVLEVDDDVLGEIMYTKITYGEHSVVECEGVVVCRLT